MSNATEMVMIPLWRYEKMVENFDRAMDELRELRERLLKVEEERRKNK